MLSTEDLYAYYLAHPAVCTDTRAIVPGCLFFALKGDNFNGNAFAAKAIELGAAYAIIDEKEFAIGEQILLTGDVLQALQDLARMHRSKLNIPFIGLTGSNGKTTTKELINAVLSTRFNTFATRGNLNNHIGVPLSILEIGPDTEIAVVEMGANHQGEIASLCEIARPTHGLITNVGMAHLEGFGGFEGVKKGKAELYKWLKDNGGTAFLYSGNVFLEEMRERLGLARVVYYGAREDDQVCGELFKADPFLQIGWKEGSRTYKVQLNITGAYNFENCLAAISAGRFFGVRPEEIVSGLESYQPVNNRSQIIRTAHNTVICDFYNANPSSMTAALDNLSALQYKKKAAILGDMFELGPESGTQHKLVADKAHKTGVDTLIFIGDFFHKDRKDNALYFKTREEAAAWITANPLKEHAVLLKGSRGMALEKLMPLL